MYIYKNNSQIENRKLILNFNRHLVAHFRDYSFGVQLNADRLVAASLKSPDAEDVDSASSYCTHYDTETDSHRSHREIDCDGCCSCCDVASCCSFVAEFV